MERKSPPRVSVIIAVYNGVSQIHDSMTSLLSQTFDDFEIIIVDDASTDGTSELIKEYPSSKIKTIRLNTNLGPSTARNKGIQCASGELIAIMDSDDIALPERLAQQVSFLDQHPEIDLVGSYVNLCYENGHESLAQRPLTHSAIAKTSSWTCPVWNTTIMFRSRIMETLSGYPEDFRHGEDYRFIVQVMKHYKIANIPQALVIKNERKDGLTLPGSLQEHFRLGLSHRLYAVKELRFGPIAYIEAIFSACAIPFVRFFGLNKENLKTYFVERPNA